MHIKGRALREGQFKEDEIQPHSLEFLIQLKGYLGKNSFYTSVVKAFGPIKNSTEKDNRIVTHVLHLNDIENISAYNHTQSNFQLEWISFAFGLIQMR